MERLINAICVLCVAGVLGGSLGIQVLGGELPCPLCLLQRVAFLGLAAGAALNVRFGPRTSHYGLSLLFAVFGAVVSARQVLLHIVPGTGGYGSAVLGMHLYSWALVFFATAVVVIGLLLLAHRPLMFPRSLSRGNVLGKGCVALLLTITVAMAVLGYMECGFSECPDNPAGYEELGGGGQS